MFFFGCVVPQERTICKWHKESVSCHTTPTVRHSHRRSESVKVTIITPFYWFGVNGCESLMRINDENFKCFSLVNLQNDNVWSENVYAERERERERENARLFRTVNCRRFVLFFFLLFLSLRYLVFLPRTVVIVDIGCNVCCCCCFFSGVSKLKSSHTQFGILPVN